MEARQNNLGSLEKVALRDEVQGARSAEHETYHQDRRVVEHRGTQQFARADTYSKFPLQQAVAIAYEQGDWAPHVVAKGKGLLAEQIIARAKEHKVFVHESKELVAMLMQVDLDDQIPPALYQAIAEILAWLYRLEHEAETYS